MSLKALVPLVVFVLLAIALWGIVDVMYSMWQLLLNVLLQLEKEKEEGTE